MNDRGGIPMKNIPCSAPRCSPKPDPDTLVFGKTFLPTICLSWTTPPARAGTTGASCLRPLAWSPLPPRFNYAQEVFACISAPSSSPPLPPGVHAAHHLLLPSSSCPVGAYYAGGSIRCGLCGAQLGRPRRQGRHRRYTKTAGNYAASAPRGRRSRTATPRCSGWTAFTGSILSPQVLPGAAEVLGAEGGGSG